MAFNLTGVFSCVQKFAQQRAAVPLELSRIVIIGSSVGFSAGSGTDIAYVSSKAALFGFSRQVACELAPLKITVNTVAPGPVETPEFMRKTSPQMRAGLSSLPLVKRLALPDEIAASVAYLVSPEASYVTGSVIDINGGSHLR